MSTEPAASRRSYRLRARLDSMAETRERITRAAFELHREVGPARTTISAIAERAGVQRHTVYRHFPDVVSLIRACTAHSLRVTGMPDPDAWLAVHDPGRRLDVALEQLYDYYRRNASLLGHMNRDVAVMPELVDGTSAARDRRAQLFAALTEGWSLPPLPQRRAEAAIGHALEYSTWRSLTSHGLSDSEARHAMRAFVEDMTRGEEPGVPPTSSRDAG